MREVGGVQLGIGDGEENERRWYWPVFGEGVAVGDLDFISKNGGSVQRSEKSGSDRRLDLPRRL